MANVITTDQTSLSGATLYATADFGGQRWNGSSFENVLAAHWSTYPIAMTESAGTGHFVASIPSGISIGTFLTTTIFRRIGGSPADSDPVVASGFGRVEGANVVPAAADVRFGVAVGAGAGTCHVPTAAQVLSGVAVDATTGNVVLPTTEQVESGVTFGPNSDLTGTLTGGGGPTPPVTFDVDPLMVISTD